MASTWIDVTDNAVKIGLGSLIALASSWLTLKLAQNHENKKQVLAQINKDIEDKTKRYVDFLTTSQSLMQKYLFTQCDGRSDDYLSYLRLHNEISITSDDFIRNHAFKLQFAVSSFIIYNKSGDSELINKLRDNGRSEASKFQYIAFVELEQLKTKTREKKVVSQIILSWFKRRITLWKIKKMDGTS
ncbi:peptidase M14 [Enterobacter bugandensis]|uniref:peptidase M14 n=1 Tax=Enterobacter bugandensis TaxID=881260 RepID=UPI002003BFC7|nr:peptidase M14 [Enterobacter bugandensis]MCE1968025.1 peptidase M14 [Enterobacter hormaechei]MCK6853458.1 peptidase M14 [Enterobacter bugandensis]MCK7373560.1 peptidase M14 [Enterobacter bugandensis]